MTRWSVSRARKFLQESEAARDSTPARSVPSLARDALVLALDPRTGKICNNATFTVPSHVCAVNRTEQRLAICTHARKGASDRGQPSPDSHYMAPRPTSPL